MRLEYKYFCGAHFIILPVALILLLSIVPSHSIVIKQAVHLLLNM